MPREVTFPVSIGLIGAPGSGKQRLVNEFVNVAGDWFEENGSPLQIVENTGIVIERDFNQAMGAFGGWAEDLWAYHERFRVEQQLRQEEESFLSIGTVLDNIAHCGINLEGIVTGLQTPESQQRQQQQQVAMTQLTFLFLQRFKYMFGFYLPYKQGVVVPGEDDLEASYSNRVDQALQMVFANFGLRIQTLGEGSYEEKAAEMFETVKKIIENGAPDLPEPEPQPEVEGLEEALRSLSSDPEAEFPYDADDRVMEVIESDDETPPQEAATLAE